MNDKLKIYYSAPIRGSQENRDIVLKTVEWLSNEDEIDLLTKDIFTLNSGLSDLGIWTRDINWLNEADILIADVTAPSHGVGYEICYMTRVKHRPVICVAHNDARVSAMLGGDLLVSTLSYSDFKYLKSHLSRWIFGKLELTSRT